MALPSRDPEKITGDQGSPKSFLRRSFFGLLTLSLVLCYCSKGIGAEPPAAKSLDANLSYAGGMGIASDGATYVFTYLKLMKFHPNGSLAWEREATVRTANARAEMNSMVVSASGEAYILVWISGVVGFGSNVFGAAEDVNTSASRFAVIKFSSDGTVEWVRTLARNTGPLFYGTIFKPRGCIDGNGDLVITSTFNFQANIEGQPFGSNGSTDIFLAKLSPAGTVKYIKNAGGAGGDFGRAVSCDNEGNTYVCGEYSSRAFFDGIIVNTGAQGFFIAKYSPLGEALWVHTKSFTDDWGTLIDIAVTPDDVIAAVGFVPVGLDNLKGIALLLDTEKKVIREQDLGLNKVPIRITPAPGTDFYVSRVVVQDPGHWQHQGDDILVERYDRFFSSNKWSFPVTSAGSDSVVSMVLNQRQELTIFGAYSGSAVIKDRFVPGTGNAYLLTLESEEVVAVITNQPASAMLWLGSHGELSVGVTSIGPVYYQWFFNGVRINGATNATLVIGNVTATNEGNYYAEVTNEGGTVRSHVAQVVIRGHVPVRVTTVSGTNVAGYVDSTNRAAARFRYPNGLEYLSGGVVSVADGHNHTVRLVDASGAAGTLAGRSVPGYVDGPASMAEFNHVIGLAVDRSLDVIVADPENHAVRRISMFGLRNVSTVAGTGLAGYRDGPVEVAQFHFPNDLVIDQNGNIFVTEFLNHTVRRISPDGMVTTFAGNGTAGFSDGVGTNAMFNQPAGIEIDGQGNLYVTDWSNHRVRRITAQGLVSTLAGTNSAGLLDGKGSGARLDRPDGITIDPHGNLYVVEHGNHAVRKVDAAGNVVTIAGLGTAGFADGDRASAMFNMPSAVMWHPEGSLWISDYGNHCIRKVEFLSGSDSSAPEVHVTLNPAITIFGKAGATYRIEAAEAANAVEAMEWKVLGTLQLESAVETWFDTQPVTRKQRFYRAIEIQN